MELEKHLAGMLLARGVPAAASLALLLVSGCTVDPSGVGGIAGDLRDGPSPLGPPARQDAGREATPPGSYPPPVAAPDASRPASPSDGTCQDRCLDATTLRTCTRGDSLCPLGCSDQGGAHCRVIQPSAGAVTPADLDTPGVSAVSINRSTTLHTDTGLIEGIRGAGASAIIAGIGFRVVGGVAVFTMGSFTLAAGATLTLVGPNPVAIVSTGEISVGGIIDARGTCLGPAPGPGGWAGGAVGQRGNGPGAGAPGRGIHDNASGGAGAGHGAPGGGGGAGRAQAGAVAGGVYSMTRLTGGSGGGGGGGANAGAGGGGGGGGAVQLVARKSVSITGGVNAGGCGGKRAAEDAGGGGGSGGLIVIEAPTIYLARAATLAVNGGGGGGADSGGDGQHGQLAAGASSGGITGDPNGARGGRGGANLAPAGDPGSNGNNGGGGGGGVGRILLYTATGAAIFDPAAILSPPLAEGGSGPAVQGKLDLR